MIIDAHTHLFTGNADASAAQLLIAMDDAGIEKAALFPSPRSAVGDDMACGMEQVLRIVKAHQDRFVAVGVAEPLGGAKTQDALAGWAADGLIRAVKFFCGYEHFSPADTDLLRPYLEIASTRQIPAIFHTGDTYSGAGVARLKFAKPLDVDEVAVAFPDLPVIIAHCGYPWLTDAGAVLYKNPNVYADISGWVYGHMIDEDRISLTRRLMELREYLGSLDKLLFGTDFPISDPKSYAKFAAELPIQESERDAILFGNAKKLFKI